MRTTRSSSRLLRGGCLPQCMLGNTPAHGCGPEMPLGVGLKTPWVWAWTHPHLGVGLETSPGQTPQPPPWVLAWKPPSGQTPQLPTWGWAWGPPRPEPSISPPGCGPGDLQVMLGNHTPPVNKILDTRFWKYYLAPSSLRAVIRLQLLSAGLNGIWIK